jgi:TnpA family transposase
MEQGTDLSTCLFHGKRGELHQRYREGQEDQLSALGLVVNVIVLWNTIYMDAALSQLRLEGILSVMKMSPDYRRLAMSTSICWVATPLWSRNR